MRPLRLTLLLVLSLAATLFARFSRGAPARHEPGLGGYPLDLASLSPDGGEEGEGEEEEERADEHPELDRWRDRLGPNGTIPSNAIALAARFRAAKMPGIGAGWSGIVGGIASGDWTELGPSNIGGRVRGLEIDPTDPNIMYAGSASGGMFKSVNGGTTWFPLNDFLATLNIGCTAMDPNDPSRIWVGTGEVQGSGGTGAGIFVTPNGGQTFNQLASTVGWVHTNRILIDEFDSNHVLAGTDAGLYLTTDGGSNWTLVDSNDIRDIEYYPNSSSILIAGTAVGTVLVSVDGGATWTQILNDAANGSQRMEVSISSTTVIFVACAGSNRFFRGVPGSSLAFIGQNSAVDLTDYHTTLWVDTNDEDTVYVGGLNLFRGTYSGGSLSLTQISDPNGAPNSPHVDHHLIVPHPDYDGTANKTVWFGNDGGLCRTLDVSTVGTGTHKTVGWTPMNDGLAISQFYAGASDRMGAIAVGGTQDNGVLMFDGSAGIWHRIDNGDGFRCAVDPRDSDVMYFETQNGKLRRSLDAGASKTLIADFDALEGAPFDTRYVMDPNDPNRLFAAPGGVWRCDNALATTPTFTQIYTNSGTVKSIVVRPGNSEEVWGGYNGGALWKSSDAVSGNPPTFTRMDNGSTPLPDRPLTALAQAPGGALFVGFNQFVSDNLWSSSDGGATFAPIGVGSLPSLPINDIVPHPSTPGWMYIATDLGIYVSEDGGPPGSRATRARPTWPSTTCGGPARSCSRRRTGAASGSPARSRRSSCPMTSRPSRPRSTTR